MLLALTEEYIGAHTMVRQQQEPSQSAPTMPNRLVATIRPALLLSALYRTSLDPVNGWRSQLVDATLYRRTLPGRAAEPLEGAARTFVEREIRLEAWERRRDAGIEGFGGDGAQVPMPPSKQKCHPATRERGQMSPVTAD